MPRPTTSVIGFPGCYPNEYAQRVMERLCTHPNVGAVLLVSLGVAAPELVEGVSLKAFLDGGAYSSFGLVTTYYAGQLLPGPLRFGTYRYRSRRAPRRARTTRWRKSS